MMAPCRLFSPGYEYLQHGDPDQVTYTIISGDRWPRYWTDEGPTGLWFRAEVVRRLRRDGLLTGRTRKASVEAIRTSNIIEFRKNFATSYSRTRIQVLLAYDGRSATSGSLRFLEASSQELAYRASLMNTIHRHSTCPWRASRHSKALCSEIQTINRHNHPVS